jgi:hypothetical protein
MCNEILFDMGVAFVLSIFLGAGVGWFLEWVWR